MTRDLVSYNNYKNSIKVTTKLYGKVSFVSVVGLLHTAEEVVNGDIDVGAQPEFGIGVAAIEGFARDK